LGDIQALIGTLNHRPEPLTRLKFGNAKAAGDKALWWQHFVAQGFDIRPKPLGHGVGLAGTAPCHHNHEFFTAEAGDGITTPDRAPDHPGNVAQHDIPRGMTELIIDALEMIHIAEQCPTSLSISLISQVRRYGCLETTT